MEATNHEGQAQAEARMPAALSLLASERPRNVSWLGAAGLLFGDWGTSRLYVLGLAFLLAGPASFWLISGMSVLILWVGWAYTQICRIYPDGGGVYSAARQRNRVLGVFGALLLFADYTVTASLSVVDAFHYFGLGDVRTLWSMHSPGLWAIVAILLIGATNLLGPKHTSGYAVVAALAMIGITLLATLVALPQLDWKSLDFGLHGESMPQMWIAFVGIVLALSGVEAIANLTGVMKKPVYTTARKSIYTVAAEVAVFNLLLALVMISVQGLGREDHKEDMLAFLAGHFLGGWGEWPVRIIGGFLLLSAGNTAINGLTSITYVMSRDGELPQVLQRLNAFGSPWVAAILAAAVPCAVLLFAHDLVTLASLYAIGVVGAIAINVSLCALHPRLRRWWRKGLMTVLGGVMVAIWLTVAFTKIHALAFVCVVISVGLITRRITRYYHSRRARPSLFRQAIMEQLTPEALSKPKMLLATAGSAQLADSALDEAKREGAALVVCFVRPVALSYMFNVDRKLTLDTDHAAQAMFIEFLEAGHKAGVPIIPMYDTGPNPAELIAELAAMNGVQKVLIGTSRRGSFHQLIKGSFQRTLEVLLPPDIPVKVITVGESSAADRRRAAVS